jgi:hypothetical protein
MNESIMLVLVYKDDCAKLRWTVLHNRSILVALFRDIYRAKLLMMSWNGKLLLLSLMHVMADSFSFSTVVRSLFLMCFIHKNNLSHEQFFFLKVEVGLVPKPGCLLTLAYCAFPRWYGFGERRWNDILTGENRRTRRKTCPTATLFTTNHTWVDPGANPGLRGERPAINDLSHGTAKSSLLHLV